MNFRKALAFSLLAPLIFTAGAAAQNFVRHSHTSTLLPDGNILVTGGRTAVNTVDNSAQVYNMGTNAMETWNVLDAARSSHTATLMSDGRVLIAGGFGAAGTPLSSIEICDPRNSACAAPAFGNTTMITARGGHTATLLSRGPKAGQVLLCGGQSANSGYVITEACEIFNPVTQTRAAAGAMVSPRTGHAAVLLHSGRIFVTGGRRGNLANTAWIYEPMNEMYDPETDTWTPVSALKTGRINHTATVLNNGKIMIAGGFNDSDRYYCGGEPGELKDDCWHLKYDPLDTQDSSNHGYVDGAEFYDQNGARVTLMEDEQHMMPYRSSLHTAVLEPDGRWKMHGGYGNIFPSFFTNSPLLTDSSVIRLTQVAGSTHSATVNGSSVIEFPLEFKLSRPVSGRLVDADLFISGVPQSDNPSIELENVKITLPPTVARADGSPVGLLLCGATPPEECEYDPGDFDGLVRLYSAGGTAVFTPQTISSGDDPITTIVSANLAMAPSPLLPTQAGRPISGSILANVNITVPDVYLRIKGVARVLSGTVVDGASLYSMSFDESGGASFSFTAAPVHDLENKTHIFSGQLNFTGLSGQMSNLTPLEGGTTFYNGVAPGTGVSINSIGGDQISLALEIDYMAEEVWTGDREPTYSFDQSTAVVREMIFSSQLGYTPSENRWTDLTNITLSPATRLPAFNHTALLSPADDTWLLGGRNCEAAPANDCLRGNKIFSASTNSTIKIPVFANSDGSDGWPVGPSLNSVRAFHTSTLLPTGHILTCGGSDGARPLATCELMDPVTREWTATGSMNSPRANHTATLLPNGNVLAAGGIAPSGIAVTSAEIFYPETQRWVLTSSMTHARQLHTATLLPDGNVLVAGGATLSTYSATAEVYISSTAYWTAPVNMVAGGGRSQHTATLMKDGRVLLAGGINGFGPMNQCQTFDYRTRAFTAANPMTYARYAHTANQLRNGYVLVAGGSDGVDALGDSEIFNGNTWTAITGDYMKYPRANHRSVLLPNGKLMLTGGEFRSVAQAAPQGFDPDVRDWSVQGTAISRTNHTSLITKDNKIINIGGWSGASYLDSVEYADFNFNPDMNGLEAETTRQVIISTGTEYFNQASTVTLLSNTSNFHGITEASGGGSGAANSSFHNPRVYLQQIDNMSGFMIDLSTRIYSAYGGKNTAWDKTLSSITVIMPIPGGELPHGWYHLRVAASGVFSAGHTVQVTVPRPDGLASEPTGQVLGTSSVTWSWNRGGITSADGYNIYSATNNVFIASATFRADTNPVYYTQTGLAPNTAAGIKVGAFNLGGSGPLAKSATYYTLAAMPYPLRVNAASFETADLEWARNNNSELTTYEVSMSPVKTPIKFSDPLAISTPVPFSVNYLSTSTVIVSLSANQMYDFRVRAMNGAGFMTDFSSGAVAANGSWISASTITVAGVNNFTGQALSSSTINWSWDASVGASYYELYDITNGTAAAVMVGSTSANNLSQTGLSANRQYYTVVSAVNDTTGFGPIRGPLSSPQAVYTLTVQPLPGVPNVYTNVSTGSLTVNWITNGNSTATVYTVALASGTIVSSYTTIENAMSFGGLAPNVRYNLRLTPKNGDGIAGTALDLGYKYTLAKVPALLTADQITMSGIALSWDPDGNSSSTFYELRSSTSDVFADPVVTHVPFSWLDTGTSAFVNGLLTGTSYYFDVAAKNGEGFVTARKRALAAFTVAGPSGAPAGSVGGTSSPSSDVTISGILPNNRTVSLTVPAGAFASETSIAISSSVQNKCNWLAGGITPVEVEIFTAGGAQPQVPVTLTLRFDQDPTAAKNDIIAKYSQVVLARYNPVSGQCLPLETRVSVGERTITATLNHFSLFQLMVRTAASDLSSVLVYPNPFYINRGQGFITIDRIPANSKVRVYTLSGDKVWESAAGSTGVVIWKGLNSTGNLVASGIYLAVIDSSAGKKVVKLAVER
ncbi:MAG TPA: hypothetical protein DEQ38_13305 [Elusimicrobia bacterium]|nr:MAG: hypothetical protein A2089_14160 [Elusimicrobia bacterium GWD2_63_28]HCC49074.1 hypothetical protein [Elusimicrobiota bacterium]